MAETHTVLPTSPAWEEGIYQLEVGDLILGYNRETGLDGLSNLQWKQLGNRTLFLRELFETEHPDGIHVLRNHDIVDNAGIPERKLELDYGTLELDERLRLLAEEFSRTKARTEQVINLGLSFAEAMNKLVPLYQEYANTRCVYELFVSDFSARPIQGTAITKEIAGDDSLDVVSTAGIKPGSSYFLTDPDGGRREEVTVMSVLTEHRIRTTTALEYTRNEGMLSLTSLVPIIGANGGAVAHGDFVYLSEYMDVLDGAVRGRLVLHRDAGETSKNVYYNVQGTNTWESAAFLETRQFTDGTVDDIFSLPAEKLRIRIEYSGGNYPYTVYYLVIQPIRAVVWIEDIRWPKVLSVVVNGDQASIKIAPYASLYAVPQHSTEVCLSSHQYFGEFAVTYQVPGDSDIVVVTIPQELLDRKQMFVSVRQFDIDGLYSRWSESVPVTV